MEEIIIIYLFLWVGISFLVAGMGKGKQLGYWGVFWFSILLSPIVGVIAAIVSQSVNQNGAESKSVGGDRYKGSLDEAKKASFKGEIEKSIGLYQDTLYYLENDYKNLNKKAEQGRISLINDIGKQIEQLKLNGE